MTQLLQTERTHIDIITLDDANFIVALVNTPDWQRFIGDPKVKDVDEARQYLQRSFLRCYEDNGFGYYLIRTLDLIPVGVCGFLKKNYLENVDFGFALHHDWYGRGLALESAHAILRYGVEQFKFRVLDAVTMPANVRSKHLLCRLGFSQHGTTCQPGSAETLDLFRWSTPEQEGASP